jgi:hypothetical protein
VVHADFDADVRVIVATGFSWVKLASQVGGQLGADLDFQELQALARVDWDPKNRAFADETAAGDSAALAVGKALDDGAAAADAIAGFDVGKGLGDGAGVADSFGRTVQFSRAFTEAAGAAEAMRISSIIRGGAISEAPIGGHP